MLVVIFCIAYFLIKFVLFLPVLENRFNYIACAALPSCFRACACACAADGGPNTLCGSLVCTPINR